MSRVSLITVAPRHPNHQTPPWIQASAEPLHQEYEQTETGTTKLTTQNTIKSNKIKDGKNKQHNND